MAESRSADQLDCPYPSQRLNPGRGYDHDTHRHLLRASPFR
jgi:hypothetical protein